MDDTNPIAAAVENVRSRIVDLANAVRPQTLSEKEHAALAALNELEKLIGLPLVPRPSLGELAASEPRHEITATGHVVLRGVPPECDVVVAGFLDHQFQPRHVRLSHQLDLGDLARLSQQGHGDVAIYPAVSKGRWIISKNEIVTAALKKIGVGE